MLTLKIYSIFDQKADAFITPFFLPNDELAKRSFYQCIQDNKHQFALSPEDFTLFHLGEFDCTKGTIIPLSVAKTLGNGVLFITNQNSENPQIDIEDIPNG